jgi:hypothetical protein
MQPINTRADDVRVARWAVIVHRAEEWPAGTFCHNDHAAFPCRTREWGRRTLTAAGWTEDAINSLSEGRAQR